MTSARSRSRRRREARTLEKYLTWEDIDEQIERDRIAAENEAKILLTGAGKTNTSRFFHLLQLNHHGDYNVTERKGFKKDVLASMIQALQALLKLNHPDLQLALSNENYRAVILGLPDSAPENDVLPSGITNAMRNLCRDPGIRNILKDQQLINVLGESSIHYLKSIDRIIRDGYTPTDEDIINRCIKPVGIAEVNLKVGELTYQIVCISRQDGARRKWMHCFEGVKAVAFLVRLDEYDQFIVTDGERRVNYIQEALETFDSICNSRWFQRTAIMLFLDVRDLFEKLSKHSLKDFFPDFTGGTDYDAACDYLLYRFVKENKYAKRQIYTNFFNSLGNPQQFKFMMSVVQDIMLQQRMGPN